MPNLTKILPTVNDTIPKVKASPKKYEEVAKDFIWLKDHPDRTSQYRFGGRKVVLSSDLPADVRAENSQRTDIWLKNFTRIPTIIGMKYNIYKLEKQFKNGEITIEQFNNKADSLGLPIYKGPSSMEKCSKKNLIFSNSEENPTIKANNTDIEAAKPSFEGSSGTEEIEKVNKELKVVKKALITPIKAAKPSYY